MQKLLSVFDYTFYIADLETGEVQLMDLCVLGNLLLTPFFPFVDNR